jgi:hypothetical protein
MATANNVKRNKHGHIIEEYVSKDKNGFHFNYRAIRYYRWHQNGQCIHRVLVDRHTTIDRDNCNSTVIYEGPSIETARNHWKAARERAVAYLSCIRLD